SFGEFKSCARWYAGEIHGYFRPSLGGSESAVFRSFLHLLLNYVYVTISSSKKDCSYIIYKFSLLVFPRAVLFGGFLRGRFLLGR
ncbi:hypothetical protein, partial [Pseudomonas aeruginosa]|uniref:hypothetical protein n=1 Tax=Pseudomonas aeruginosa TaxID=287 RepID=UPI0026EEE847